MPLRVTVPFAARPSWEEGMVRCQSTLSFQEERTLTVIVWLAASDSR